MPDGLLRAVEERYGLTGLEPGARLAGGYANDIVCLDGPSACVVRRSPAVERAQVWARESVTETASASLSSGPAHGNLFPGNVLVRGRRAIAILDWEELGIVPPESDLPAPFVRVNRLLEVLRAPTDRTVDWAYEAANLDAFSRLA